MSVAFDGSQVSQKKRRPSHWDDVAIAEAKGQEAAPDSSSKVVLAAFLFLGAGSGAFWGALILCVGTLAEAYHDTAVFSSMASVQNNSWLWTMVFFTVIPKPASHRVTLAFLSVATVAMLVLAVVFARMIGGAIAFPSENHFLLIIGVNGVCTGTAQILAASLSGLFSVSNSAVPSTLLLGVTAGPLLLATLSLALPAAGVDPSQVSAVTLWTSAMFLCLSLIAILRISREEAPAKIVTVGTCNSDGGANKEYLCRRIAEMAANAGLLILTLLFGNIMLCSVPYGAPHVCEGDTGCQANLSRVMVAACTVSQFVGRLLFTLCSGDRSIRCIAVSVILRAGFAGTLAWAYSGGRFPVGTSGQALAIAGISLVTIWGNGVTIDLSRESQRACGHSLAFPCPITAQISWISLQSGSLLGSLSSFFFK